MTARMTGRAASASPTTRRTRRPSSCASGPPAGARSAASTHWAAPSGDLERLRRASCPTTDVLVVLGGDGTFLRAARAVAEVDVPLLGINLGKVGFLSKAEAQRARGGPRAARRRATTRIERADGARGPRSCAAAEPADGDRHVALNDVVVARGVAGPGRAASTSRSTTSHLATFIADGLVVASPTGSTGYSFSAGGPILDPISRNLVVTPDRRLPVGDPLGRRRARSQVVRCTVVDAYEALVSIDGREDLPLAVGDVVEVRAARAARSGSSSRAARCRSGTCCATRSSCCRRDDP